MPMLERETDKLNFIKFLTLYFLSQKRLDHPEGVRESEISKNLESVLNNQQPSWIPLIDKSLRQSTIMVLSGHLSLDRKGNYSITDAGINSMDRLKLAYASAEDSLFQNTIMKLSNLCDEQCNEALFNPNKTASNVVSIKKTMRNGGI